MRTATRRAIIAAAGLSAAGTVAALALLRKPQGPAVATLVPGAANPPPVKIGGVEQIRRTEPPVAPAPASFTDAEGTALTLAAYADKGLVVNLWATWCVPCVAEMPELAALARAMGPEGISVLPLSSDRGGAEVVRRFYAAHGIAGLPVLLDPKGAAARAWGARGLPTTLIIDRQGRERARVEGAIDWAGEAVKAEIRRLTA